MVLWAMLGWNGRCNDSWKIKANGEKQLLPTIIMYVSLLFENNFRLSVLLKLDGVISKANEATSASVALT